jgi:NAD(P)-dependent dehydrogenase (short-subunit alcohol dehydrogenase family)
VAVVTGGNRGMGLETCRQLAKLNYTVILTSRDSDKGQIAAQRLAAQYPSVHYRQLDVTETNHINSLAFFLQQEFGRCDVLVNNAGVFLDFNNPARPEEGAALRANPDRIRQSIETNTIGPLQLVQALVPLMRLNNYGRIVNVSSSMGQISSMSGGWPGYRISKAALNMLTIMVASETNADNIKVNAASPGGVKTGMGGSSESLTPERGVDTAIWLATLPDNGPTGGFWHDRRLIAW